MASVIAASVNVLLTSAARPANVPTRRQTVSHRTATKRVRDMENVIATSVNASRRISDGSARARGAMRA